LWALETWPNGEFMGLTFDRIDNNGHYSKDNLRVVDYRTNILNRDMDVWRESIQKTLNKKRSMTSST
jgi:hypothetical protein